MMTNHLIFASLVSIPLVAIPLLYWAYTNPKNKQKNTNVVLYVHDSLGGENKTAMTMAGINGPTSSIFDFGTLLTHDDAVTISPDPMSMEIGRAQGMYVNSQLDGKAIFMAFSVMFTDGEYKGSSLDIMGAERFLLPEREFSVVSGTGYFRFARGYGVMTTYSRDIPNVRYIIKLDITVRHF